MLQRDLLRTVEAVEAQRQRLGPRHLPRQPSPRAAKEVEAERDRLREQQAPDS